MKKFTSNSFDAYFPENEEGSDAIDSEHAWLYDYVITIMNGFHTINQSKNPTMIQYIHQIMTLVSSLAFNLLIPILDKLPTMEGQKALVTKVCTDFSDSLFAGLMLNDSDSDVKN